MARSVRGQAQSTIDHITYSLNLVVICGEWAMELQPKGILVLPMDRQMFMLHALKFLASQQKDSNLYQFVKLLKHALPLRTP